VKLTSHHVRIALQERVELSPEQYGELLEEEVEQEDQLLMDLTMETNNWAKDDAWHHVNSVMMKTFPGYSHEDMEWMKRRFRYIRERTAARARRR